ncbi:hypothetical protein ABW19_dt0200992 [Dactylella cylindrospora]|nr:hypothetical protein ABW19_dt0200992 [Dactylella cylindrospora]
MNPFVPILVPDGLKLPPIPESWKCKVFSFDPDETAKDIQNLTGKRRTFEPREDFAAFDLTIVPVRHILVKEAPLEFDMSKLQAMEDLILCTAQSANLARQFQLHKFTEFPPNRTATDEILHTIWTRYLFAVVQEYGMVGLEEFWDTLLKQMLPIMEEKIRDAYEDSLGE